MSFGFNPALPIFSAGSSPSGENDDPATEEPGETDQSAASGAGDATATEQSSSAPSATQTSEAQAKQTVQPVSSDVAIAKFDRSDVSKVDPLSEQDVLAAKKLAMKARSEVIVAALVEAITAPIDAKELDFLSGPEGANGIAQTDAQTLTEQFEDGLSAIRESD